METIKLTIPKMKSPHCQMTVGNTVRSIGAEVKNLAPGEVEIKLTNDLTKKEVVSAIEKVGYTVIND